MIKKEPQNNSLKIWLLIFLVSILYFLLDFIFHIPNIIHYILLFFIGTALMIWRLNHLMYKGFEGTVLGTLIMPYASGFPNLVFVLIIAFSGGAGVLVLENAIVNNVTNLTLVLGLPALIWGISIIHRKKKEIKKHLESQINKVSLMMTISAAIVFTITLWALASDNTIDFNDGLVLIIMFLFWQLFQISEVAKNNIRERKTIQYNIIFDIVLIGISAYVIYLSMNLLIGFISSYENAFINKSNLGWITGWLSVLPNASLAMYYGWKHRGEIVYSSQIGDGHICIPFCIGLFAIFSSITISPIFQTAIIIMLVSLIIHLLFVSMLGRLPRFVGALLVISYIAFLYIGLM